MWNPDAILKRTLIREKGLFHLRFFLWLWVLVTAPARFGPYGSKVFLSWYVGVCVCVRVCECVGEKERDRGISGRGRHKVGICESRICCQVYHISKQQNDALFHSSECLPFIKDGHGMTLCLSSVKKQK